MIEAQYILVTYDIGRKLLWHMLPKWNRLPTSRHIVRWSMTSLRGLGYDHIHACTNDCILFRGMHKEARHCSTCGEARYRIDVKSYDVPCNVLWHFLIISCIKHIFKFKSISESHVTTFLALIRRLNGGISFLLHHIPKWCTIHSLIWSIWRM